MKYILECILAALARRVIRKYKPKIIGVTGSVGKTSTRLAIYAVVGKKFCTRSAEKNYNNAIGFPLAILGIPNYGRNVSGWARGITHVIFRVLLAGIEYPEFLVLEYGVDRPGDMERLLSIARPDTVVMTAVGSIPAHVEFFEDAAALVAEKSKLLENVSRPGTVVLDRDDQRFSLLNRRTHGAGVRVLTYGFSERAHVRIVHCHPAMAEHVGSVVVSPEGMRFKIEHAGSMVPVELRQTIGVPQVIAAAAAAAVGIANGLNLIEIADALCGLIPAPGRLQLIEGADGVTIIDDSYNAALESMHAALDVLETLPAGRKIAVLGDMRELGRFSASAHRAVGERVAEFADILIVCGASARGIADAVSEPSVQRKSLRLEPGSVFRFTDSREAAQYLKTIIQRGDLVLVKGSQAMRMERVVEAVMAHPELAATLLARQEPGWKRKE